MWIKKLPLNTTSFDKLLCRIAYLIDSFTMEFYKKIEINFLKKT